MEKRKIGLKSPTYGKLRLGNICRGSVSLGQFEFLLDELPHAAHETHGERHFTQGRVELRVA